MADEKIFSLIKLIKEQTIKGRINWEKTLNDGVYLASFPEYSIQISLVPAENESYDVLLQILNKDNIVIEEVRDPDLRNNLGTAAYSYMYDLYTMARRKAEGVDAAIDIIISALSEDNDKKTPQ